MKHTRKTGVVRKMPMHASISSAEASLPPTPQGIIEGTLDIIIVSLSHAQRRTFVVDYALASHSIFETTSDCPQIEALLAESLRMTCMIVHHRRAPVGALATKYFDPIVRISYHNALD